MMLCKMYKCTRTLDANVKGQLTFMTMFECYLKAMKSAVEFSRLRFIKNADNGANLTETDRIRNAIVQFGASYVSI